MVKALQDWAARELKSINPEFTWHSGLWQPLKGDAGFRQYFRVLGNPSYIVVYAPVATEDSQLFVKIAQYLARYGVHTPEVKAVDYEQGFLILEDLGTQTYFEHLQASRVDELYGRAMETLHTIQRAPLDEQIFGQYDAIVLHREMTLFTEWFIPQLLDYSLNAAEQALISDTFSCLIGELEKQPKVLVHRDYHSQNIMYGPQAQPGIVDFQDALIGPITYDLVSLLRDCYVVWPVSQVEEWALSYAHRAISNGVLDKVPDTQFLRWFDWMGLQRHIKVLGIFARLSIRDNKHKYLHDLPLVIHYFRSVAAGYGETQPLLTWFDTHLMPIIEEQPWMKTVDLP